jgi:hypothetical protein
MTSTTLLYTPRWRTAGGSGCRSKADSGKRTARKCHHLESINKFAVATEAIKAWQQVFHLTVLATLPVASFNQWHQIHNLHKTSSSDAAIGSGCGPHAGSQNTWKANHRRFPISYTHLYSHNVCMLQSAQDVDLPQDTWKANPTQTHPHTTLGCCNRLRVWTSRRIREEPIIGAFVSLIFLMA